MYKLVIMGQEMMWDRREAGHWHPPIHAGHFTLKAWIGTYSLSGPSVRKCLRFVNMHKCLWADQRVHELNRGLRQRYTCPSPGLLESKVGFPATYLSETADCECPPADFNHVSMGGSVSWNLCPPPLDIRPSQYVNAIIHCLLQVFVVITYRC